MASATRRGQQDEVKANSSLLSKGPELLNSYAMCCVPCGSRKFWGLCSPAVDEVTCLCFLHHELQPSFNAPALHLLLAFLSGVSTA